MTRETLRALVEAATPGPWEDKHPPGDAWVGSPFKGPIDAYRNTGSLGGVAVIGVRMDDDDAAFIAASRTAVPLLLAVADAAAGFIEAQTENDHPRSALVLLIAALAALDDTP